MKTNPIQILLADDDEDDRLIFDMALKNSKVNAELKSVIDGVFLMKYMNEQPDPGPDVIFLDINMPRKDGIECLRELREKPELKDIPVLMFSTSISDRHVKDAHDLGANRFVRKPIDIGAHARLLQKLLEDGWQEKLKTIPAHEFLIVV